MYGFSFRLSYICNYVLTSIMLYVQMYVKIFKTNNLKHLQEFIGNTCRAEFYMIIVTPVYTIMFICCLNRCMSKVTCNNA